MKGNNQEVKEEHLLLKSSSACRRQGPNVHFACFAVGGTGEEAPIS